MPLQTMACEKNGNGAGALGVLTAVLVGIVVRRCRGSFKFKRLLQHDLISLLFYVVFTIRVLI